VIPRLLRWLNRTLVGAQMRGEWRRFLEDRPARSRAAALALAAGVLLLLTWPTNPVLTLNSGPFAYTAVGTLAVLMTAYLGFVRGARISPAQGRFTVQEWAAFVPLSPPVYLHGALFGRLLEPAFFLLVLVPVLLPAAALEGVKAPMLGAALLVLGLTALTGRIAALALLLWLEHRPLLLISAVHVAMWTPFLLGWVWGPVSPLPAFYSTFSGGETGTWGVAAWVAFVPIQATLSAALYVLCLWRVRMLRKAPRSAQEVRPAEIPAG
jgi:hypothetical protein